MDWFLYDRDICHERVKMNLIFSHLSKVVIRYCEDSKILEKDIYPISWHMSLSISPENVRNPRFVMVSVCIKRNQWHEMS